MTSPIKEALSSLSRHAGLVEDALRGPLDPRDDISPKAIMDLRQASALRPTGDEGYRLNPRLRDYFFDHLQHFPAYQSLSEIGSKITNIRSLWSQVEELRYTSDLDSTLELRDRLQDTAYDIADNMRRNLQQLQNLLSTRYGNVRTLEAKKSQNRWYQQQSGTLIRDLGLLSVAAYKIEQEAASFGMPEFAQFIRRNLITYLLDWQQGLSEMQTLLRKEIFQTHEIERHHRQLARIDMLLRQQPGWTGIEIEMDGELPDFLLSTRLPALHPHVEPDDSERDIRALIEQTAASLPPVVSGAVEEERKRYTRKRTDREAPPKTPGMLAAQRLTKHVLNAADGVSLSEWRLGDLDAMTISPNVWLIFATMDLRQQSIRVTPLRSEPRTGERWQHTFFDAVASGPKRNFGQMERIGS